MAQERLDAVNAELTRVYGENIALVQEVMQLKQVMSDRLVEIQLKQELKEKIQLEIKHKVALSQHQTDTIAALTAENADIVTNITTLRGQLDKEIYESQLLKQKNDEIVSTILSLSSECANKLNEVNELSGKIPLKLEDEYEIIEAEEETTPQMARSQGPSSFRKAANSVSEEGRKGGGFRPAARSFTSSSQSDMELIDFNKYLHTSGDAGVCTLRATSIWTGHQLDVSEVHFSDQRLYSASGDGTVKAWDPGSCALQAVYDSQGEALLCLDVTDRFVCAGTVSGHTMLWDLKKGKLQRLLTGHTNRVTGVKVLNTAAVTVSADGTLKLWDTNKTTYRETYNTEESCTSLCMMSANIAIGLRSGNIQLWTSGQPHKTASVSICESAITSVALTPDENALLINCKDSRLRILDLRTLAIRQSLTHKDYLNGSPYGRASMSWSGLVAAGGQDGRVFIWKPEKSLQAKVLQRQRFLVTCCAWRVETLCSADSHGGIVLWD